MAKEPTREKALGDGWEEHARHDPLWAILSRDDKRGREWDIDEFFTVGAYDVDRIIKELADQGIRPQTASALDFGCGVGRLTQALADHFDHVVGVDVSRTMIGLARALNFNGDRVEFLLNQADHLAAAEDDAFDFVSSLITLQHVASEVAHDYLKEFLRILKPGGILVFDLPAARRSESDDFVDNDPMPSAAYRAKIRLIDAPEAMPTSSEATLRVIVENNSGRDWEPGELALRGLDTYWQAGDRSWKSCKIGHIDVGNHWLELDGLTLINDDGRVELPQGLAAGAQAEVELLIKSPAKTAVYTCEVDVVHERVMWFAQRGSPTARCRIAVGEPLRRTVRPWRVRAIPGSKRLRSIVEWLTFTILNRRRALRRRRHHVARRWEELRARLPKPETADEPEPYWIFGTPRDEVMELLEHNGGEVLAVEETSSAGWVWESYRYVVRKS